MTLKNKIKTFFTKPSSDCDIEGVVETSGCDLVSSQDHCREVAQKTGVVKEQIFSHLGVLVHEGTTVECLLKSIRNTNDNFAKMEPGNEDEKAIKKEVLSVLQLSSDFLEQYHGKLSECAIITDGAGYIANEVHSLMEEVRNVVNCGNASSEDVSMILEKSSDIKDELCKAYEETNALTHDSAEVSSAQGGLLITQDTSVDDNGLWGSNSNDDSIDLIDDEEITELKKQLEIVESEKLELINESREIVKKSNMLRGYVGELRAEIERLLIEVSEKKEQMRILEEKSQAEKVEYERSIQELTEKIEAETTVYNETVQKLRSEMEREKSQNAKSFQDLEEGFIRERSNYKDKIYGLQSAIQEEKAAYEKNITQWELQKRETDTLLLQTLQCAEEQEDGWKISLEETKVLAEKLNERDEEIQKLKNTLLQLEEAKYKSMFIAQKNDKEDGDVIPPSFEKLVGGFKATAESAQEEKDKIVKEKDQLQAELQKMNTVLQEHTSKIAQQETVILKQKEVVQTEMSNNTKLQKSLAVAKNNEKNLSVKNGELKLREKEQQNKMQDVLKENKKLQKRVQELLRVSVQNQSAIDTLEKKPEAVKHDHGSLSDRSNGISVKNTDVSSVPMNIRETLDTGGIKMTFQEVLHYDMMRIEETQGYIQDIFADIYKKRGPLVTAVFGKKILKSIDEDSFVENYENAKNVLAEIASAYNVCVKPLTELIQTLQDSREPSDKRIVFEDIGAFFQKIDTVFKSISSLLKDIEFLTEQRRSLQEWIGIEKRGNILSINKQKEIGYDLLISQSIKYLERDVCSENSTRIMKPMLSRSQRKAIQKHEKAIKRIRRKDQDTEDSYKECFTSIVESEARRSKEPNENEYVQGQYNIRLSASC